MEYSTLLSFSQGAMLYPNRLSQRARQKRSSKKKLAAIMNKDISEDETFLKIITFGLR